MAVEKIILDIQAKVGKAKRDINSLRTGTKSLNKEVSKTSSLLKKAGAALIAFGALRMITRAIKEMITLNKEFEKTLTNVLTLLDKTAKAKFGDFLSAGALRTMSQFGLEVNDVNKALFDTISAGVKAGNSIKFLNEAAKLAVGGVTSLSIAVDGMTSIMNAYKLSIDDANKVASAFFAAQKFGKTTVAELAQNVGMLAPTMKMAGIGFQEMLAGMALLTKQGISTDMATTALRATIIALTKTTPETAKIFKKLGIETGIVAIKTKGFMETLMQVAKAAQENEDILTQVIPSVRALTAVAAMGEEALVEYAEILEFITTNYGEGSEAAAAYILQMGTLQKKTDVFKGTWKELNIELGKTIKLKEGLGIFFEFLTSGFEKLISKMRGPESAQSKVDEFAKSLEGLTSEERRAAIIDQMIHLQSMIETTAELKEEFRENIDIVMDSDKAMKSYMTQIRLLKEGFEELIKVQEKQKEPGKKGKKPELPEDILTTQKFGGDELVTLREDFVLYMDVLGQMSDDIVSNEEETQIKLADIKEKFRKEGEEADQDAADAAIRIEQYKAENKLIIVQGAAGLLRGLAGENFAVQKILAIAESIISTFLSAQLAYQSMVWIPGVGPGLAKAAKTNALIGGAANTAMIIGTALAGFEEGGFTGKSKLSLKDRDGPIAGFVHEDEFVFNREKTKILRPLFDDIQYNRIDIVGLAALTRRGMMQTIPKLNADILENEVKKIYRKMSESNPREPTYVYYDHGYTKKIGNITINVSN